MQSASMSTLALASVPVFWHTRYALFTFINAATMNVRVFEVAGFDERKEVFIR
jgi:hypothetical protein